MGKTNEIHLYEVYKYSNKDFREIESWYSLRSMQVKEDLLPNIGFIIHGIAAGFLIQTDCNIGFLEPFIANPQSSMADRDEALKLILLKLTESAKLLGYQFIYGIATSQTMINRSLDLGFTNLGSNSLVIKDLTHEFS